MGTGTILEHMELNDKWVVNLIGFLNIIDERKRTTAGLNYYHMVDKMERIRKTVCPYCGSDRSALIVGKESKEHLMGCQVCHKSFNRF